MAKNNKKKQTNAKPYSDLKLEELIATVASQVDEKVAAAVA